MSPLRVGMDGGALFRPGTGIGRYTTELARALTELPDAPELVLLANSFRAARPGGLPAEGFGRIVNPRIPHRILHTLWSRLHWPPVDLLLGSVDVFHTSDWVHPPQRAGATVTTVHDLGALVHPEWYTPDVVERHREKNLASLADADALVTVSEFTRRELLGLFDVDPGRIHTVPNGVGPDFRPPSPDEAARLRGEAGVEGPYLLYVGTREPRKNLPGLVEIFARVADEIEDVELVVVGMRPWVEARRVQGVSAWTGRELEARVEALGLGDRIRFPGRVPFDVLRALYAGATCFVFPTLYEGFGLPTLEAMACGAPVVASDRTAVPEVVGEAGLLADPEDVDAFAAAVVRVLEEDGLADMLRERGRERAAAFGWDRTARETLDVYRRVVDRS